MRRVYLPIVLAASIAGCSAGAGQTESETVQMKEETVDEIEREPEPEPAPPPQPEPQEEELALEMFEVAPDSPVVTGKGIEIRMTSPAPDWGFTLSRSGQTVTATHTGSPLYIEGIAFGQLFEFTESNGAAQVTLRSDAPASPLPPETALDIARTERQNRLACEGSQEQTAVQSNGTVVLSVVGGSGEEVCRIVVGRYTGNVVDL